MVGGGRPRQMSPLVLQRMQQLNTDQAEASPPPERSTPRRSVSPRLRQRVDSFSRGGKAACSKEPGAAASRAAPAERKFAGIPFRGRPSEAQTVVAATQSSAFAATPPRPQPDGYGSLSISKETAAGIASTFGGGGSPPARATPAAATPVDPQREWLQMALAEISPQGGRLDSVRSASDDEPSPPPRPADPAPSAVVRDAAIAVQQSYRQHRVTPPAPPAPADNADPTPSAPGALPAERVAAAVAAGWEGMQALIGEALGGGAWQRAVNAVPDDWEEEQALEAFEELLSRPDETAHLWLLLSPRGD